MKFIGFDFSPYRRLRKLEEEDAEKATRIVVIGSPPSAAQLEMVARIRAEEADLIVVASPYARTVVVESDVSEKDWDR